MLRGEREAAITDDRGSVLLLGIGMVVVLVMLLLVVADVAALAMARRSADLQAEAAARAAAQGLDLGRYYTRGSTAALPLDRTAAAGRAEDFLRRTLADCRMESLDIVDGRVRVAVAHRVPLVMGRLVGRPEARVLGHGAAELRRLPSAP